MTDVTRALLLPDVHEPSDPLLKTLAIYWDQLVLPDYVERAGPVEEPISEFGQTSTTLGELEENGIISREQRKASLPPIDTSTLPPSLTDPAIPEGAQRMMAAFLPVLKLIEMRPEVDENFAELLENKDRELHAAGSLALDRIMTYAAEHYMGRMRDSFALSRDNNLAPVARSAVSHVASMLDEPEDVPKAEAALISAAIQAFEVDPGTSVEQILRFRERNEGSLGRFRASLVDLSEGLRQDAASTRLLAEARDRYRNRVVPALGDLEEVLKDGKIRFFVRSLMGATALTLSPIEPMKAVEGGATLVSQTINYRFSRDRLVRDHPFGYLHQVSSELGPADGGGSPSQTLQEAIEDPEAKIQEMFRGDLRKKEIIRVFQNLWYVLEEKPESS